MEPQEARRAAEKQAGGRSSLANLYDSHVDEVYRFVHRRCRDHALAEDITQETFMAAVRSADDPSSISIGWLLTVARNRLFDVLRRQARYADKLRLVGTDGASGNDAELAERLRVEAALDELSVDYRLVLTLRYLDGLPVSALAERLDRSEESIDGLVTRARRALRAKLDEGSEASITGGGSNG